MKNSYYILTPILLILLFGSRIKAQIIHAPVSVEKSTSKKIFIHWMPWFETPESKGDWGYHWKMNTKNPNTIVNGQRDIASYYYPKTGPYASGDPDIIEYQLLLMKFSGADGVFIDWPGTRVRYDYPDNLANCNKLIDRLDEVGLQFSIVEEDRNWDAGMQLNARGDFAYMNTHYFTNSQYFTFNDGPVVLNFGPITFHNSSDWNTILSVPGMTKPDFLPLFGFTSQVGANNAGGEFPWIYENHPTVVNSYYAQSSNFATSIGIVYPGFNSFYAAGGADGPTWTIAYNGTTTFNTMLNKALSSNVDIIQFATWNDHGEGTGIEPTVENGYGFLTSMQTTLGISLDQSDLEQVYRLYTLRKQFKTDTSIQHKLDQVFYDFVSLKNAEAVAIMDSIAVNTANIAQLEEDAMFIYPNPVTDQLNYHLPPAFNSHIFTISDLTGRQFINRIIHNKNQDNIMDLSFLPGGFYLLKINGGRYQRTFKLVKH